MNHVLGGYSRLRRYMPRMLRRLDVAGAERVPQVEQHRRLPEAVIGLGA